MFLHSLSLEYGLLTADFVSTSREHFDVGTCTHRRYIVFAVCSIDAIGDYITRYRSERVGAF